LNSTVGGGFGSSPSGRFDIVWTERDCDNFHDTEPDGVDVRFDPHPEPNAPEKHFHEPPHANPRVPSCIEVEQVDVVVSPEETDAFVEFLEARGFEATASHRKKWVSDTEVIGFEKRLTPQQPIGFDLLVNGLGCRQTEAQ
jgi:hypothetical protein